MSPVTIELRKGRKRRPSNSLEDVDDPVMDDCMAAMVLMSLSCSPKSTFIPDRGIYSVSVKSIDSGVGFGSTASRSNTPSPCTINEEPSAASPIAIEINNNSNHVETIKGNNDSNVDNNQINGLTITHKDEGIDMDETIDFIIEDPIQTIAEKARRIVFKCTWRGCGLRCDLVESIEKHIRTVHLGRSENASEEENDHEEEFYYAEIEEEMETENIIISSKDSSSSNDSSLGPLSPVSSSPESPHSTNYNLSPTLSSASLLFFAPSPTWSHLDMARPPHEDPEYQKQQKQMQLQLQLQQQQIQIQNQQVQNFNHHLLQQTQQQQPSSVTQTIISAQVKPEPERKTVISSPINIPGISVAHRWSTKMRDSSSSSLFSANSCNSSYSFSNSHHHHHHHHFNQHHQHQSQASLLASSSSPVNFFSPKAPSKVMRLSSNTSSPINIKSSGSNNNTTSITSTLSGTVTVNSNSKTNSNNVTSIISSSNNPTMSTNTTTNANNNASSNQWTSLLQSSSTSSSASSSSSSSASSSSSSTTGTATTLLKGSSISPTRRTRTETRKCRKVYGMDNRDSWCTQCKWKKACTRFVD